MRSAVRMGRNGPVTSMMVWPGTSTLPSPTYQIRGRSGSSWRNVSVTHALPASTPDWRARKATCAVAASGTERGGDVAIGQQVLGQGACHRVGHHRIGARVVQGMRVRGHCPGSWMRDAPCTWRSRQRGLGVRVVAAGVGAPALGARTCRDEKGIGQLQEVAQLACGHRSRAVAQGVGHVGDAFGRLLQRLARSAPRRPRRSSCAATNRATSPRRASFPRPSSARREVARAARRSGCRRGERRRGRPAEPRFVRARRDPTRCARPGGRRTPCLRAANSKPTGWPRARPCTPPRRRPTDRVTPSRPTGRSPRPPTGDVPQARSGANRSRGRGRSMSATPQWSGSAAGSAPDRWRPAKDDRCPARPYGPPWPGSPRLAGPTRPRTGPPRRSRNNAPCPRSASESSGRGMAG